MTRGEMGPAGKTPIRVVEQEDGTAPPVDERVYFPIYEPARMGPMREEDMRRYEQVIADLGMEVRFRLDPAESQYRSDCPVCQGEGSFVLTLMPLQGRVLYWCHKCSEWIEARGLDLDEQGNRIWQMGERYHDNLAVTHVMVRTSWLDDQGRGWVHPQHERRPTFPNLVTRLEWMILVELRELARAGTDRVSRSQLLENVRYYLGLAGLSASDRSFKKALANLVDEGYVGRSQERNDKGQIVRSVYTLDYPSAVDSGRQAYLEVRLADTVPS